MTTQKPLGRIIVLSGPSGAGKGSVIAPVLAKFPTIHLALSATTRPKRSGESDGTHYFFKTDAEFEQLIQDDAFLEWCHVHKHRYGTLKNTVHTTIQTGHHSLIEIDTQGFKKVRQHCDPLSIFIAPPSLEALAERLTKRQTETPQDIESRLAVAKVELESQGDYAYTIINADLAEAQHQLTQILEKELI